MAWETTMNKAASLGVLNAQYQYLFQTPESYHISSTTPTMERHAGLYTTLTVQPLLLTLIFVARMLMRTTPVRDDSNLITFLAGLKRESLDVLKRTRSGRRGRDEPVMVHFLAGDEEAGLSIRYFPAPGSRSRPDR